MKKFAILVVALGYVMLSDFGNGIKLVKDFKEHVGNKVNTEYTQKKDALTDFIDNKKDEAVYAYELKTTEYSNTIRDAIGMEKIPLPTKLGNIADNNAVNVEPSKMPPTEEESVYKKLPLYNIPFYYDNSNAPSGVTKEEALSMIKEASKMWENSCGVRFEYKGDRLADYAYNKKTLKGDIGIIKWETQLDDDAIGEAHLGNESSYAKGFVLALKASYFGADREDAVNTIGHEMGHVIGIEHSASQYSLMYPTQIEGASLQKSDGAMCEYYRYRWNGETRKEAEDKAGIVHNGGYKGDADAQETNEQKASPKKRRFL